MLNKQIIDNLSVEDCCFFNNGFCTKCDMRAILHSDILCLEKENNDCSYKKWQRAEKQIAKDEEIQVDMRLKIDELYGERNVLNTANGALNNLVAELKQQLKAKEKECEELKEQLEPLQDKYFQGLDTIAVAGLAKLILQKISECEGNNGT